MVTAVQRDHTVYVPDAPELDMKMVKRINAMFCSFSTIRKSDGAATYGEPGVSRVASGQRVGPAPLWALVLGSSCPVPLQGNGEGMGCPRPRRGPAKTETQSSGGCGNDGGRCSWPSRPVCVCLLSLGGAGRGGGSGRPSLPPWPPAGYAGVTLAAQRLGWGLCWAPHSGGMAPPLGGWPGPLQPTPAPPSSPTWARAGSRPDCCQASP